MSTAGFSLRHFPSREGNRFRLLGTAFLSNSLFAKTYKDFHSYLLLHVLCSFPHNTTLIDSFLDAVWYLYFLLKCYFIQGNNICFQLLIPHTPSRLSSLYRDPTSSIRPNGSLNEYCYMIELIN